MSKFVNGVMLAASLATSGMVDDPNFQQGDGRQFTVYASEYAANNGGKLDLNEVTSGFSDFTLKSMGLSPSAALLQLGRQVAIDDPESIGLAGCRAAGAEEENARDIGRENQTSWEAKQDQQKQWEEAQREQQKWFENKQWEQAQWEEKQRIEQQRLEEQRLAQQQGVDPNAANNQIMMMPFVMAGGVMMLGLGADAIGAAGAAMSPHADDLKTQTMVASNNGGEMLAAARGALGQQVTPGQDVLVSGPNSAVPFAPGATPDPAPGVTMNNVMSGPQTGLSGPSLKLGGMV